MNNKNQQIIDAFQFRHACKKFDSTKVIPTEDFNTILEAGRLSPSSFGFEPWRFLIIQDSKLRKKLFPVSWGAQNSLDGASHFVIILARKKIDTLYSSEYITNIMSEVQKLPNEVAAGKRAAFEKFQKNDFNLLENDRALYDWASKQTYIALANMLTTAAFLGIDSCPIEGFNINEVEKILQEDGILDAEHFGVSVMAGFGYRVQEPYQKTRQTLDNIVQWI
ncbi:NAD(P)H-dependent oxidoreductase [Clostridium saccharoperbutylacetonicum]|uniref:Nitroreductase n=1 Tax=Clostridium saccharoperbutylacetonicum N1-4(HMT) TaxID=931276 RepID=M1LNB1_9CLOT|nr:NAD(P)H-dependent oxidoreductase [Clostridium saccharoperbutylacetonicum]AGF54275.1 nitroreductase [Clostridium saccharoperbutylacetonicum N1-4(HMT)]AQR93192.1 putative NAD(P)H nitroreductase YfkO [Clostridium saccharoperbutylacetonicum]NRT59209.1 nitroreductase [Clostridium saccharoperbutylacetonicum]NSB28398.1 nitroreductase [Clostridium saccharoperbutylacetonicum]NSB34609.1 nitroreductase [Clostridium saccharoperbutylacetonicum]